MIAAILHGPNHEDPALDAANIEVHDTAQDAIESLSQRLDSSGRAFCTVKMLDGHYQSSLFPDFGEGTHLHLYNIPDRPNDPHGKWKVKDALLAVQGQGDGIIMVDEDGDIMAALNFNPFE